MSAELAKRTKAFAVRVLRVADALPPTASGKAMAGQIARSGTSVAANFRAAMRGRIKAEFISKLHIACEESDETQFWIELIEEYGALPGEKLHDLHRESSEITAILTASLKTAKANLKKSRRQPMTPDKVIKPEARFRYRSPNTRALEALPKTLAAEG